LKCFGVVHCDKCKRIIELINSCKIIIPEDGFYTLSGIGTRKFKKGDFVEPQIMCLCGHLIKPKINGIEVVDEESFM